MKASIGALLLALLGCGGSEEPASAKPPPGPRPPASAQAPAVTLPEPPESILRNYPSGRHSKEILGEALRQTFAAQARRYDSFRCEEAFRLLHSLKGKPEEAAAEQGVADGLAEALKGFSKPAPEFLAIENRASRFATPKVCRVLIDAYLRVDKPAGEKILFEKSFEWIATAPNSPLEMYFPPNVLIALARERDPRRARAGMLAWLESSARIPLGQLNGGMLNQIDEGVMSILDEGATKEDFKRVAGHPLMVQAPYGFIFRWGVSRKAKFDLDAEDLADILVRQLEARGAGFNLQSFEPVVGKSLAGTNEALVRGLAKILPKTGAQMAKSWSGWVEYLGPGFQGLSPAEMKALQDRLRPSPDGLAGMRVLCTYLVSIQKAAREGTAGVFAAALGPDATQNQKWLELFAYDLPGDASNELAKALQRPEIPLASLEQGVSTALNRKWKQAMVPVLQTAFRTRKENLQNLQGIARSHYTAAEWDRITRR